MTKSCNKRAGKSCEMGFYRNLSLGELAKDVECHVSIKAHSSRIIN